MEVNDVKISTILHLLPCSTFIIPTSIFNTQENNLMIPSIRLISRNRTSNLILFFYLIKGQEVYRDNAMLDLVLQTIF